MVGETDGVDLAPVQVVDGDAVGDQRPAVDLAAARGDGDEVRVIDARLRGERRADLTEQFRLEFGEPGQPTAHRPARVVLGEPVGRDDVRIPWVHRLVVRVVGPVEEPGGRAVLDLVVEQVRHGRLDGLVVDGERPVLEADRREEPALAVTLHDERPVAGDGVNTFRVSVGTVVGAFVGLEVGDVEARPLPLLLVPPDVLLLLAPGLALGVCGGTIVEDAAVRRPRPAPLGGGVGLLGPGLAAAGLIHAVGHYARVDPTPARRRAIILQISKPIHRLARLHRVTADLLEDALDVRLLALALHRIVPRKSLNESITRLV